MTAGSDKISCLLSNTSISDLPACMISIFGSSSSAVAFYALIFLFIGGWSLGLGITRGMMIGGFFGVIAGLAAWSAGFIGISNIIVPFIFLLLGILMIQLNKSS